MNLTVGIRSSAMTILPASPDSHVVVCVRPLELHGPFRETIMNARNLFGQAEVLAVGMKMHRKRRFRSQTPTDRVRAWLPFREVSTLVSCSIVALPCSLAVVLGCCRRSLPAGPAFCGRSASATVQRCDSRLIEHAGSAFPLLNLLAAGACSSGPGAGAQGAPRAAKEDGRGWQRGRQRHRRCRQQQQV